MQTVEQRFEVGGLRYIFRAVDGGEVVFYVTGGATPKRAFTTNWYHDDRDLRSGADGDYFGSASGVLLIVQQLLLEWVRTHRPYRFRFCATTQRKQAIYEWAARRIADRLAGRYVAYEYGGTFWFVRRQVEVRSA